MGRCRDAWRIFKLLRLNEVISGSVFIRPKANFLLHLYGRWMIGSFLIYIYSGCPWKDSWIFMGRNARLVWIIQPNVWTTGRAASYLSFQCFSSSVRHFPFILTIKKSVSNAFLMLFCGALQSHVQLIWSLCEASIKAKKVSQISQNDRLSAEIPFSVTILQSNKSVQSNK